MKKLFLLFAVLTINNSLFSQSIVVHNYGGFDDTYDIATVDSITFLPFQCGVNKVSYAGIIYNTVQIGSQCWFKENLNVGTRINGGIPQTNNSVIEKYCYNDNAPNCTTYGGLYQWAEAVAYANGATNTALANPPLTGNVQGICPIGWHIPTYAEYQTLTSTVSNNGNALKAVGQGGGNGAGTNTSGFSALLAGYRFGGGGYDYLTGNTWFWSSTEYNNLFAYYMALSNTDSGIYFSSSYAKSDGFSIRCVKD